MSNSDAAAKKCSVIGWLSASGRFYAGDTEDSERTARWDGGTHSICECGAIYGHKMGIKCPDCLEKDRLLRHRSAKQERWDGNDPIYADSGSRAEGRYFNDFEELETYCEDNGTTPKNLLLYHCKPNFARELDYCHFENEMPEDECVLPAELVEAMNAFNSAVAAYGKALSWSPDFTRAVGSGTEVSHAQI